MRMLQAADGPFNVDGPKQLAEEMTGARDSGCPLRKKTKTGFSTDQQVLANLAAIASAARESARVPPFDETEEYVFGCFRR